MNRTFLLATSVVGVGRDFRADHSLSVMRTHGGPINQGSLLYVAELT
jgi:hypothetical protein